MMHTVVVVLNLVVSVASAAWAVMALARPASLSGSESVSRGEVFYARMYAARSVPLGLACAILPFRFAGSAVAWVLFTAAAVQALDVAIAVRKRDRGMSVGASIGATIHLLCGFAVR